MLQDKVVLITGGMGALGKKIIMAFAAAGAQVVVTDLVIKEEAKASLVAEVAATSGSVTFKELDVTDLGQCQEVVKGLEQVDVLINNAGITRDNLIMRMKTAEWQSVIDVNLTGSFNMLKAVSRPMMRKRQGVVINVVSIAGQMGNVGQANYSASKAGLIGLTKTAARELAPRNIRVNAVAPGFIAVGMTEELADDIKEAFIKQIPLGRAGTAEEVAQAIIFLAGAEYITGHVLSVNGGLYM